SYDGKTNAVDDVSLDVERGEFLTLLGPSGSGKTTTLLMIAGFETPTSGVIELDGQDLVRSKPYERNIGMVFQNYALFPHMTAAKNVVFPLKMRRFPKHDINARAAHARARGLAPVRRQVSARIVRRPAAAGRARARPRVQSGCASARRAAGRARQEFTRADASRDQAHPSRGRHHHVYVTHDQIEAMTMSDRIAVFCNGKVEQVGSPLDVYNRPANRFVGEFIG